MILEVKDLAISFSGRKVVDGVSFTLEHGKVTSLVGESGSGKTMTAFSVLNLLPAAARLEGGKVLYRDKDLLSLAGEEIRKIRGNDIAIVFQEPFTALNPVMRIGEQIEEAISTHTGLSNKEITLKVGELLETVKLALDTVDRYPHELSGGMRQRVMLAVALSCDPEVLILDEPTTALDVSIQKHVLDLIKQIQSQRHLAILFITHDFSVVNMIADEVCVMREGVIVERGDKDRVLKSPFHPYTQKLIRCIPKLGDSRERLPG